MTKLDYSLQSPEERNELVKKILAEMDEEPTPQYLEVLADYLVLAIEKQKKREERNLLTENRLATIRKRETSLEGLISQFENGEDGFYNLIAESDKNALFKPKISITKKDLEDIPELTQVREAIKYWEEKFKTAQGRDRYIIKKAIIDLRKDQYAIKEAYRKPMSGKNLMHQTTYITLDDDYAFDEDGYVIPKGVSLIDPKVISAILCSYSALKEAAHAQFHGDLWYLMQEFDNIASIGLNEYPMYERIVEYKVDGLQNIDIQEKIQNEFGITHSVEYISNLWRNKIPKLIASAAEDQFLDWYYLEVERGTYKKCSRCKQVKLAHNKYFSKNKTSKDGFYSICKCCRNAKDKKI